MWSYKISAWLRYATALGVSVGLFLFVALFQSTAIPYATDKEYYLYSPSSQAEITTDLSFVDLPYIKGECARIKTSDSEKDLQAAINRYAANVVKTELFDGGVSYYCYSEKLKTPILLDAEFVNLHIVVKTDELLIATPILFGGY